MRVKEDFLLLVNDLLTMRKFVLMSLRLLEGGFEGNKRIQKRQKFGCDDEEKDSLREENGRISKKDSQEPSSMRVASCCFLW
jgi:hypothetical protein